MVSSKKILQFSFIPQWRPQVDEFSHFWADPRLRYPVWTLKIFVSIFFCKILPPQNLDFTDQYKAKSYLLSKDPSRGAQYLYFHQLQTNDVGPQEKCPYGFPFKNVEPLSWFRPKWYTIHSITYGYASFPISFWIKIERVEPMSNYNGWEGVFSSVVNNHDLTQQRQGNPSVRLILMIACVLIYLSNLATL